MRNVAYLALPAVLLVGAFSVPVKGDTTEGFIAFFAYGARMVETLDELVTFQASKGVAPFDVTLSGP